MESAREIDRGVSLSGRIIRPHTYSDRSASATLASSMLPSLMATPKIKAGTENISKDHQIPNKKPKKQEEANDDQTTSKQQQLPALPDEVIHHILRLLPYNIPIKTAAGMSLLSEQWRAVFSSLNLDDGATTYPFYGRDKGMEAQAKFVNFLERYLEFRKIDNYMLDKFRLRMRKYSPSTLMHRLSTSNLPPVAEKKVVTRDITGIVDKWLRFAIERMAKEFDVRIKAEQCLRYYSLSLEMLLSAKSITNLILENIRIDQGSATANSHSLCLPSLITMSFRKVKFSPNSQCFSLLISNCPSIQCLEIASCTFHPEMNISSSSLKSLRLIGCKSKAFRVETRNIESFAFSSNHHILESLTLCELPNLKNIIIRSQKLKKFVSYGWKDSVEAIISIPIFCNPTILASVR